LRRAADPDEVARAIAWVASDEASYLTATVVTVGGGL
jgi:NAD(P)-dependent dehydrogenase (short-subunit alcohol dehydrogenase family)